MMLFDDDEIDSLNSHIFRHIFCTYLAAINLHSSKAQKLMGHSSARTTMDVYTHLPIISRYENSLIYKFYKELLVSQKSVKRKIVKIKRLLIEQ